MAAFGEFNPTLFLILFIIGIIMACIAIAKFFNFSIAQYMPYLTWLLALALFSILLPKKVGTIFLNNTK